MGSTPLKFSIRQPQPAAQAWKALAQLSTDMLVLLDGRGRIVWTNPAFENLSGRSPEEAAGLSLARLFETGQADGPWAEVDRALAQGRPVSALELPWRHASGDFRWGRLVATPVGDEGGSAQTAVSLQDLTEQHKLAERLEIAQEFGRMGVWERRIASGEGQWDRHVFRFFGLDPAHGTPDFGTAALRVHPEDREGVADFIQSKRACGRYEVRYRVMLPDGGVRRIHSQWEVKASLDGVPDRIVGIMVDDTQTYELARAFNETSEQLRLAVDLGNIAIWRQDLRTNRLYYNHRAFEVIGITPRPEGLSLDEVRAIIHPDDLPSVLGASGTALESDRPVDMEARYRRPDGSWRYVLTRRVVRRDAENRPIEFVGVALDVTDQLDKSRRAIELAQRLEVASQAAGLGVFSRDPETGEGQWNAQMFRLTGRPPELGVPTRDEWVETLVYPEDRPALRQARELLLSGESAEHEQQYRVARPDGEIRWLVNRARRVMHNNRPMIYGITLDLTDRMNTELDLRRANERVALAAHSAGMGTWEWEPHSDARVWDEQMFRLRGRQPQMEAPGGAERRQMLHPQDRDRIEALLLRAVAEQRSAAYDFRVVWPDGSIHWLASRSTPLVVEGQPLRYIGVNWDITDSVNAEAAQRDKLVAVRESEAKSQFLARMSHELRTPLNAVLGFAQLLQFDGADLSDEQKSRVHHILSAGEHLLSLVNDVLDLSSLEGNQPRVDMQPVPMLQLVEEVMPLVDRLSDSFQVRVVTGHVEGTVRADRTRLRQVLINLLSNAIKYNRPGGEAVVESQVLAHTVVLRVCDTGRGLSADQQQHLFEPFNRLGIENEGIEGTGIGLAIVKTLVMRMGGSIHVHSTPGQGSTFEVRLPRCDPAPARAVRPPHKAEAAGRQRQATLLYIEDNPMNVMLVQELCADRPGIRFFTEATGEAGVARARELLPELVLVDMQLPDFDGYEVLRRLRSLPETAAIPCLALSANAMPADISRALQEGFAEYWTKPIDLNELLCALDARLGGPSVETDSAQPA